LQKTFQTVLALAASHALNYRELTLQELRLAIDQKDTLTACLLVAGHFASDMSAADYHGRVNALVEDLSAMLDKETTDELRFTQLVNYFYTKLSFSASESELFSSKHSLLDQVIDYRTGIPVTLSILFCHIAQKLGFDVHGVNFPGHFIIRYQVSAERVSYVDPLTGQFLSWQALELLYFSILGEIDDEEMPLDALDAANTEEVVLRLLQNLKAAFMKEEKYQSALLTANLLIALCPEDPYERRDRGYLLHQLVCPQVALADYKFFILKCPLDPSAQLLKLQIRQFDTTLPMVVH
jgi:regulator of sirC expression with transglutaminase-like and TPR domain